MSLVGPSIHVCYILKYHLLALEGDKDALDSILKPLIIQSPLANAKDTNSKDSDDYPILDHEVGSAILWAVNNEWRVKNGNLWAVRKVKHLVIGPLVSYYRGILA